MKKIGLTQRVTYLEHYHERRDSLDQRWYPFILELGYMPIPLPNLPTDNTTEYIQTLDLAAIILTGGNSLPPDMSDAAPERDLFETALLNWAIQVDCPVIGVCRGMQMINHYFGGTLSPVQEHVAVKHTLNFCGRWQQYPSREVNSYHNWGIAPNELGPDLQATAFHTDATGKQTIEALQHLHKNIIGIMWHPERLQPYANADLDLLRSLL